MTSPHRAAIYLRTSTTAQHTENQRLELERIAERRGWTVTEVYEDFGISGAKGCDKRPASIGCSKTPIGVGSMSRWHGRLTESGAR